MTDQKNRTPSRILQSKMRKSCPRRENQIFYLAGSENDKSTPTKADTELQNRRKYLKHNGYLVKTHQPKPILTQYAI